MKPQQFPPLFLLLSNIKIVLIKRYHLDTSALVSNASNLLEMIRNWMFDPTLYALLVRSHFSTISHHIFKVRL